MMSDIRSKEGFAYGSDLVGMGKEGTLPMYSSGSLSRARKNSN